MKLLQAIAKLAALYPPSIDSVIEQPPSLPPVVEVENTIKPLPPRFIRYVRYLDELNGGVASLGGISFIFELNPPANSFKFSYSICSDKDRFNKKVSNSILSSRINSGDWYEVQNFSNRYSLITNVYLAILNHLEDEPSRLFQQHISTFSPRSKDTELKKLAQSIFMNYDPVDLGSKQALLFS